MHSKSAPETYVPSTENPERVVADRAQEEELIEAAQGGDPDAFGTLLDAYRGHLFRICSSYLWNHEDAEDALQEISLKLWGNIQIYEAEKSSFSTWIGSIATNTCISLLRKKKHTEPSLAIKDQETGEFREPKVAHPQPDSLMKLLHSERCRITLEKIKGLVPRQREMIQRVLLEEMNYIDVAAQSKVPEGTIRSRVFYGREILRRRVGATFGLKEGGFSRFSE